VFRLVPVDEDHFLPRFVRGDVLHHLDGGEDPMASVGSPDRGHGGRGAVTLTVPLVLSQSQAVEALRIRAVCIEYQHDLVGGLAGRAAFRVAEIRARREQIPATYLFHIARAVQLMRREGQPITRWSRLSLITGGVHVAPVDPLRVWIDGLGEVRAEMFRLLSADPRAVPRPGPGLGGLLAERARIEAADRERPGWPGGAVPHVRKAVLCRGPGGWRMVTTVGIPDLGLMQAPSRVRAGLDIGLRPLGVLADSVGHTEVLALRGMTPAEASRTEMRVRDLLLTRGVMPEVVRAYLLPWRQAVYLGGLAALTPLLERLPELSSLAIEGLQLSRPRDRVERNLSRLTGPYALPDVLECLPGWCRQSGTVLQSVDSSYSSHMCPRCGGSVLPGRVRVTCPACGHSGDRHAWAAQILMQRGARL
jgi:Putative transposase DNA-binding domain